EVAIKHDWLRAQDLFVIGDEFKFGKGSTVNSVYLKVLVKPLVNLIWLAGFVFLIGSLITLWPDAREQQRIGGGAEPCVAPGTPGRPSQRSQGSSSPGKRFTFVPPPNTCDGRSRSRWQSDLSSQGSTRATSSPPARPRPRQG